MSTLKDEPGYGRRYHHGGLREALVERAVAVIGEAGVDAVSLRGLARDLGVSHAAPGRHFASRDALLAAVAENGVDRLVAATEAAVGACVDDPVEQLKAMASAYLRWAAEHPAHYNAVRNPEVTRHAHASLGAKMSAFFARQQSALLSAQTRSGVDPGLTMFRLVAVLVGTATVMADPLYRNVIGKVEINDTIEQTVSAVLRDRGAANPDA